MYCHTYLPSSTTRTTNHIEGGINSRLKELVHRHRGLGDEQKQVFVAWTFLKSYFGFSVINRLIKKQEGLHRGQ